VPEVTADGDSAPAAPTTARSPRPSGPDGCPTETGGLGGSSPLAGTAALAGPEPVKVTPCGQPPTTADTFGGRVRISAGWTGLPAGTRWPLAVQSLLTARLTWSNSEFSDEALYLCAGRLELAHLRIGRLARTRLFSAAFVLGVTTELHRITRRLFDRRAAFSVSYTGHGDTHARTGHADLIRHGYFAVILLLFVENPYVDGQIERDVSLSAPYRTINSIPHAAPGGPRDYLV
jgi:hypothetical protein